MIDGTTLLTVMPGAGDLLGRHPCEVQHGELADRVGEAVGLGGRGRFAGGEDDSPLADRLHHAQGVLGDDRGRHEVQVELLLELVGIELGQR